MFSPGENYFRLQVINNLNPREESLAPEDA